MTIRFRDGSEIRAYAVKKSNERLRVAGVLLVFKFPIRETVIEFTLQRRETAVRRAA